VLFVLTLFVNAVARVVVLRAARASAQSRGGGARPGVADAAEAAAVGA
jgi:hypothetical protein